MLTIFPPVEFGAEHLVQVKKVHQTPPHPPFLLVPSFHRAHLPLYHPSFVVSFLVYIASDCMPAVDRESRSQLNGKILCFYYHSLIAKSRCFSSFCISYYDLLSSVQCFTINSSYWHCQQSFFLHPPTTKGLSSSLIIQLFFVRSLNINVSIGKEKGTPILFTILW